jgi:hypothetical protein
LRSPFKTFCIGILDSTGRPNPEKLKYKTEDAALKIAVFDPSVEVRGRVRFLAKAKGNFRPTKGQTEQPWSEPALQRAAIRNSRFGFGRKADGACNAQCRSTDGKVLEVQQNLRAE